MKTGSQQKTINPWDYKPWWCQPWSILLTGAVLISVSWLLFRTLWITLLVSVPAVIWMSFFLLIWPKIMLESGLLDPYLKSTTADPENR